MSALTTEVKVKCLYCHAFEIIVPQDSRKAFITLCSNFTRKHNKCDSNKRTEQARQKKQQKINKFIENISIN